jgi:thioredoxin-like negative regulator of GroEL
VVEVVRKKAAEKPWLVFFHSGHSGRCRRVEATLAGILVQGQNHETFRLYRVNVDERPEVAARFSVEQVPTLLVLDGRRVRGRLEVGKGSAKRQIEEFLAP